MVADINSGVIYSLLPVNVIFVALTMYNSEHVNMLLTYENPNLLFHFQSSFDWVMLTFHLICLISSMCWPFLFCYYSSLVTEQTSSISDIAYNTNWYEYPPEYQKYMILIIARSQELTYFTGFNLIRCSLETFGKVSSLIIRENLLCVKHSSIFS